MQILDSNGLQFLIDKIQDGTIKKHEYTDVIGFGEETELSTVMFIAVTPLSAIKPWTIEYRVRTNITGNENTMQFAEVKIGGVHNKISSYSTFNIIYDSEQLSVKKHIILRNKDNNRIYIGIDLKEFYNDNHDINVEIKSFKNCQVSIFKNIKCMIEIYDGSELVNCILKEIDFTKDGVLTTENEKLSRVATTGSYNDLLDKPQILEVALDEEDEGTIVFSYKD